MLQHTFNSASMIRSACANASLSGNLIRSVWKVCTPCMSSRCDDIMPSYPGLLDSRRWSNQSIRKQIVEVSTQLDNTTICYMVSTVKSHMGGRVGITSCCRTSEYETGQVSYMHQGNITLSSSNHRLLVSLNAERLL